MTFRDALNRDSQSSTKKIYLHEADEYVGPFCNRVEAEKFIALMELFGASREGIEIVERDGELEAVTPFYSISLSHPCYGK